VQRLRAGLDAIAEDARAYFEEWMDPLISGIRWVPRRIAVDRGSRQRQ